jgi:Ca2+-binding RTX toxin-like protein
MMQSQIRSIKRKTSPAICESLESRRMLVANLTILYDGQVLTPEQGNIPTDFGTVAKNSVLFSKTITLRSTGTTPLEVDSLGSNAFTKTADLNGVLLGDFVNVGVLNPGQEFQFKVKFLTGSTGDVADSVNINCNDPDSGEGFRRIKFRALVVAPTASSTTDWGLVSNETHGDSFFITGQSRADTFGNTLVGITDHLIRFELSGPSNSVQMGLGGVYRMDSSHAGGAPSALLTRDSDGDGEMSVSEREDDLTSLMVLPPNTDSASPLTLSAGKYFIYLTAVNTVNNSGGPFTTLKLDADVQIQVQQVAAPVVEVRGNGVLISNNDTSPSAADKTSFGTVASGSSPTLTFTVKNVGGSALNISGQKPNVSGDFVVTDGLKSSIAPGASDTFKVKLVSTNIGAKQGTIVIKSNAGDFTFKVGGTVIAGPPVSLVEGIVRVNGTSGNDTIIINRSGDQVSVSGLGSVPGPFAIGDIDGILIDAADGNDSVSTVPATLKISQTIFGGAGDDTLRGAKGKDSLDGGGGRDRLDGAGNTDTLKGGAGSDYAYYRSRNFDLKLSLDGIANDGEPGEKDLITGDVENIEGGKGDDVISGDAHNNVLRGNEGNDTLTGNRGDDSLDAGPGRNSLYGGRGDDVLVAANGKKDTVSGGENDDSLTGDLIDLISGVENKTLA